MGSIAPPPTPKVIRATSHTTRATARRGKMCETLHKKTSADRGDLAYPPSPPPPPSLSATDWQSCPTSVARLQQYLSLCQAFWGWQATISSRNKKKKKKKRVVIGNGGLISWTWTAITKDKMLILLPNDFFYRAVFLPTASTYTTCLLRLLLYRNRQLGCLESTLEQYLEQLARK